MYPVQTRIRSLAFVLATSALALAACDDGTTSHQSSVVFPDDECVCLALGADYTNNAGAAVAFGIPSLTTRDGVANGGLSGDPVVRYADGKFYIVNRLAANVTVVDASTLDLDEQFSVGEESSNAYDIAIDGHDAWVVYFADANVKVFDLTDTMAAPAVIPLPKIDADTSDGNPEASSIAIVDGKAYVTVQHLDNFVPAATGQVVVIDVATKTVEGSYDLANQNPTNFVRADGSTIYLGTTPDYTVETGCFEKIVAGAEPTTQCVTTSHTLGGYVTGIAPAGDGTVFIATAQSFSEGKVVRVSAGGVVEPDAYTPAGQQPTDVAACGKYLVANDLVVGGVRVYDTTTRTELTTAPISPGEPSAFANGIACFTK